MKCTTALLIACLALSCNNNPTQATDNPTNNTTAAAKGSGGKYKGSFSNGMKGATISFEISSDGKELRDLTFEGYWRCDGSLDLTTIGPEKPYAIQNGKVNGVITEPEGGGAPFHFELQASIGDNTAEGKLRFANVSAGCDTYLLDWTATKQ